MGENPTLMRLKELGVPEKVTEKVDKLTVFGGLEDVLKDTVRINARPDWRSRNNCKGPAIRPDPPSTGGAS